MKELIDRLREQAGLSEEQAVQSIEVIKDFTKEKFPMFSDAIDKLFDKYGSSTGNNDFLE